MSSETNYGANLGAMKNSASVGYGASATMDMSGNAMVQSTQSINYTGSTQINFGGISGAPAKVLIRNLDDTQTVKLASDGGMVNLQDAILPGDFVLRSLTSGTLYAQAYGGATNALILVIAVSA